MTKFFIYTLAIFTLIKAANFHVTSIGSPAVSGSEMKEDRFATKPNNSIPEKNIPMNMEDHENSPRSNSHTPAMDETPHIHHFHKQRIRKIRKHHGKFWILSQLLLVVCHLTILYIGYLHLVSH